MKKIQLLSLACTVGILSVITACGSEKSQSAAPAEVTYHASYPEFTSSEELYSKADLVIEVEVQPGTEVQNLPAGGTDSDDPRLNPEAGGGSGEQPAEDPVVVTVHKIRITELHKGVGNVGDIVEVKELGGDLDGTEYISEGTTPLIAGKPYLLFLTTFPDAPASMITPVQGQYPLDAAGEPQPLRGNKLKMTTEGLEQLTRAAGQ